LKKQKQKQQKIKINFYTSLVSRRLAFNSLLGCVKFTGRRLTV